MHCFLGFIVWSIFDRFLLPTWIPWTSFFEPPLQGEHDLTKNRVSQQASIFDRFWCQLASQKRPKCIKNRCQEAPHHGLHIFIDFWSLFAPNLDPVDVKKVNFSWRKTRFFCFNRLSKITSISASILVPKSFPKSSKIPSKIDFQSHRIFNRFSH